MIFRQGFADAWDRFLGNDENVDGSLGLDVADGEAKVVFVFEVGWDLAVGDFLEKRFGFWHEREVFRLENYE